MDIYFKGSYIGYKENNLGAYGGVYFRVDNLSYDEKVILCTHLDRYKGDVSGFIKSYEMGNNTLEVDIRTTYVLADMNSVIVFMCLGLFSTTGLRIPELNIYGDAGALENLSFIEGVSHGIKRQ